MSAPWSLSIITQNLLWNTSFNKISERDLTLSIFLALPGTFTYMLYADVWKSVTMSLTSAFPMPSRKTLRECGFVHPKQCTYIQYSTHIFARTRECSIIVNVFLIARLISLAGQFFSAVVPAITQISVSSIPWCTAFSKYAWYFPLGNPIFALSNDYSTSRTLKFNHGSYIGSHWSVCTPFWYSRAGFQPS